MQVHCGGAGHSNDVIRLRTTFCNTVLSKLSMSVNDAVLVNNNEGGTGKTTPYMGVGRGELPRRCCKPRGRGYLASPGYGRGYELINKDDLGSGFSAFLPRGKTELRSGIIASCAKIRGCHGQAHGDAMSPGHRATGFPCRLGSLAL